MSAIDKSFFIFTFVFFFLCIFICNCVHILANCRFSYFFGNLFSWIWETLVFCGYLISRLRQSLYAKPLENVLFVKHLHVWSTFTQENHYYWYPKSNHESTVLSKHKQEFSLLFKPKYSRVWYMKDQFKV